VVVLILLEANWIPISSVAVFSIGFIVGAAFAT